jgi:hypothetical protein
VVRSVTANSFVQAATFLFCALALVQFHDSRPLPETSHDAYVKTVVEQVARAPLNIHEGSSILFLDDPLDKDEGNVLVYTIRLYYQVHDVTVDRAKSFPEKINQASIDSYDILLNYDAKGIVAVKR